MKSSQQQRIRKIAGLVYRNVGSSKQVSVNAFGAQGIAEAIAGIIRGNDSLRKARRKNRAACCFTYEERPECIGVKFAIFPLIPRDKDDVGGKFAR